MQDIKQIIKRLDTLLLSSFSKIPKNKKIGVLLSGGVDSSLILKYAIDFNLNPVAYTAGSEFSKDREFVNKLAKDLDFELIIVELSKEKISQTIPQIIKVLEEIKIDPNIMQVSLSLPFYFIAKTARKNGVDLFLSGQGSDELFGGYHKYEKLSGQELINKMNLDTENLFKIDIIRDRKMAAESDMDIYFPYLDEEFIEYTKSIPTELKIKGVIKKWILRQLARKKGLPDYIYNRPKNALQYSSGVQKIVERIMR